MRSEKGALLLRIFKRLLKVYGKRNWYPVTTRFEVIIGAILSQNVSWKNAKKALNNLKDSQLLNPTDLYSSSEKRIASLIKPSRFYNQKAEKIKNFMKYFHKRHNGSLDRMFALSMDLLRKELLAIKGIGKETADTILLYAGKKMSFVSDAYTKRFVVRYGLKNANPSYEEIRQYFMSNLPSALYLYNEFHALIVHHCSSLCQAKPKCGECVLANNCEYVN